MLYPLFALSCMAVIAGFTPVAETLSPAFHHPSHSFSLTNPVFLISLAALIIGIGSGILVYRGRDSDPLEGSAIFKIFRNKFYFDEVYLVLVRIFQNAVAMVVHFLDDFIIGNLLVGGLVRTASGVGNLFRKLQSGNLQGYAFLFGAGIILIIYLTVFAR